jgi:hypothetical protein
MKLKDQLTEGPLGFPLTDRQCFTLEALLKQLPREPQYAYRKTVVEKATSELLPGERADVSWITSEDPDRANEVVVARGMNDSQFQLNPIVTMQHCYHLPPVGKSLWRKKAKDGDRVGVKAKTQYPQKPDQWPDDEWPPDVVFPLVQSGLLNGKSIGFLPVKVHTPADSEIDKNQWSKAPSLIIDEWVLLEYACCYLPCQQNAIVESVSKSFADALGIIKGVVPYEDTSKAAANHPWDAHAARERLHKWANGDMAKYKRGFAYVDGDGSRAADYKLPHHDIIDGKLTVVYHGLTAAMAALNGARSEMNLSEEDRTRVYNHLKKHYQQFGKEPPEPKTIIPFLTLDDYEAALYRRFESIDWTAIANTHLDRIRGRV